MGMSRSLSALEAADPRANRPVLDPDFSSEEYERRVEAVRVEMRARHADILIVDQYDHLAYLFGYLPSSAMYQACLLPLEGAPHMIMRALDLPVLFAQSWVRSYAAYADTDDPIEVLADEVRRLAPSALAIESDSYFMTLQRYQQLVTALPGLEIVDFARVIWELRLIKSEAEIAYLRTAARIADTALVRAIEAAREGGSEREPATIAYSTALEMGADNGRIRLQASGSQSDALHGRLGKRRFAAGDLLHIELVPQVRGYSSRIMRPTVIGEPTSEQRHVAERLIAIQDEQIAAMLPGAVGADVDRITRQQVLREGLRAQYTNVTGYTLGFHAQPRTSDFTRAFLPNAVWRLEPGMVFHMWTWARSMTFSETVLVTQEGPERLTKAERRLFIR
jgi:Xaa-Pro dipeptidase